MSFLILSVLHNKCFWTSVADQVDILHHCTPSTGSKTLYHIPRKKRCGTHSLNYTVLTTADARLISKEWFWPYYMTDGFLKSSLLDKTSGHYMSWTWSIKLVSTVNAVSYEWQMMCLMKSMVLTGMFSPRRVPKNVNRIDRRLE